MQPFEDPEHLIGEFRFDADAIVADGEHTFMAVIGGRDVNRWLICTAEFDRVVDQMVEDFLNLVFIGNHWGSSIN